MNRMEIGESLAVVFVGPFVGLLCQSFNFFRSTKSVEKTRKKEESPNVIYFALCWPLMNRNSKQNETEEENGYGEGTPQRFVAKGSAAVIIFGCLLRLQPVI